MTPEIDPRAPRDDVTARTRAGDTGRWAWIRASWAKWGELIKGVSGIVACAGCLILGVLMFLGNQEQTRDQQAVRILAQEQLKITQAQADQQLRTAAAAKVSCQRAKAYGPALADYYERQHVLPVAVIEAYRKTIPTSCPK